MFLAESHTKHREATVCVYWWLLDILEKKKKKRNECFSRRRLQTFGDGGKKFLHYKHM